MLTQLLALLAVAVPFTVVALLLLGWLVAHWWFERGYDEMFRE